MIRYFHIKADYKPFPQVTVEDCAKMARAFLLYPLGAYLFANRRQMVSLRWLALFRDFGEAQEAYYVQACLAYLYSSLDTLSRRTLHHLVGLGSSLRSIFLHFLVCGLCIQTKLCIMLLQDISMRLSCKLSSCKLHIFISCKLSSYIL